MVKFSASLVMHRPVLRHPGCLGYLRAAMRFHAVMMVCCFLAACAQPGKPTDRYRARIDNPSNYSAIDSVVRLLHDGDIALRTGADMTSIMLRGMNQRDRSFSHCGIVLVEDGYPFVYHSIGGEDNPDARLRRDSARWFFSPATNERLGIARLDLDSGQFARLGAVARRYFKAGIPFDMDFDLVSDDRFYCAEFVLKSVQEAVADPHYFTHSKAMNREYVGVDNITDTGHARIVCDLRYKL